MAVILDKTKLLGFRLGSGSTLDGRIGVKPPSPTAAKIGVKPV